MNANQVAATIKERGVPLSPALIAIDGHGGSGKSTIAEALKRELGKAYIIAIDDFIIKEKIVERSSDEVLFDRDRLKRQVLESARKGLAIEYQRLEWADNRLSSFIKVPATDYLIIEGISSCHPDIADYFDYKIWIDTPIELAKLRGKQRDAGNENEQHWELWSANDLAYQSKYHPELEADFIIENA